MADSLVLMMTAGSSRMGQRYWVTHFLCRRGLLSEQMKLGLRVSAYVCCPTASSESKTFIAGAV